MKINPTVKSFVCSFYYFKCKLTDLNFNLCSFYNGLKMTKNHIIVVPDVISNTSTERSLLLAIKSI